MLATFRASVKLWRPSLTLPQTSAAVQTCVGRDSRPLHTQPCKQYLSRYARGVRKWEEVAQSRDEGGNEESLDFEAVCNGMIENLKINRHAKTSNITKIFDHVTTPEQLHLAESVLVSFRQSLSKPTPALPLVAVRACLRLGRLKKALHYVRNKVRYGVFPSRRVYHILMDAFIREEDAAGAVAVYEQMLTDEVIPDGMTFHLASRAHVMMNTAEGLEAAVSLWRLCHELEPKLGSKSFIILVKTLLEQSRGTEALELLEETEAKQLLRPQTQLNLLTHTLVAVDELGRILAVLKEKLCVPSEEVSAPYQQLGLPQEAWPHLRTAVQDSRDGELIRQLENLTNDLIANRRLS